MNQKYDRYKLTAKKLFCQPTYTFTKKPKSTRKNSGFPVFTICMCTHNYTEVFNASVSSVLDQTFEDWELIILENGSSNDIAWTMIENAMETDTRIHGIRLTENVGWAKGMSICLSHAKGKYATFLAADDCLHPDGLMNIYAQVKEYNPDIVWVGMLYLRYNGKDVEVLSDIIPSQKMVLSKHSKTLNALKIMSTLYYNSMFHYVKIDFLKENDIDFFQPYYGDCAGMTYALSKAKTMVVLNDLVYYLVTNTSQTSGIYTWEAYKTVFSLQWDILRKMSIEEGAFSKAILEYFAKRIGENHLANLMLLCSGAKCRDMYMNGIIKQPAERFRELEDTLSHPAIIDLADNYGRYEYFSKIQKILNEFESAFGILNADTIASSKWLKGIAIYLYSGNKTEHLIEFAESLLHPDNKGMLGFEFFIMEIEQLQNEKIFAEIAPYAMQALKAFGNRSKNRLQILMEDYIHSNLLKPEYFQQFYDFFMLLYEESRGILKNDRELEIMKLTVENYINGRVF